MATFFPRNLDPFGDGSLQESWTFTDINGSGTLMNQKGDNELSPYNPGSYLTNQKYNYNSRQMTFDSWLKSTKTIVLTGSVDATFMAFMKSTNSYNNGITLSLGEAGQRYNIEIMLNVNQYYTFSVHKGGVTSGTISGISHTGYVHCCGVYTASDETTRFYVNGNLVYSAVQEVKFNNSKCIQISSNTDDPNGITDVMYFTKALTVVEINQIKDNAFPALPPLRGLDPFLDGSLVESYMFEKSFGNDQCTGVSTLEGNFYDSSGA